ncbi:MAG: hypothetical protein A3J28_15015 [Acidobacteria bacterium RIFCSPLOWO2_12_FULL_60_22]|nr:MAG: hypothetical protein A3J28_15015 [Acidobacteria bacterium RIFCSPLOWO2_12_FULL_60_22]
MPRSHGLLRILGFGAALLWVGLPASQTASLPSTGLMGTVKSSDGKPMEGVAISARAQDKTFTTSVYTNQDGEYFFPSLADGQYRVWAQAVGFEMTRSEQAISSGKKIQQNFTLKPFQDFHKQLNATEWMNSLPDSTPEDREMRQVFHYLCSTCHDAGYVLSKRFDAAGWGIVIDTMLNHEADANPDSVTRRLMETYKEGLVGFLSKVRGPKPYPLKYKPLPRPTGESAEVVVTEYDIPRGDSTVYTRNHNGSDWSEGIPSREQEEVLHDAVVGKDGYVYFTDGATPGRTTGRLDPKTGLVTGFQTPGKSGFAASTHGASVDQKGNIWYTSTSEGSIATFDPKTEKIQIFAKPSSMSRGIRTGVAIDSKGYAWAAQPNGAFRVNPATGEFTEYKAIFEKGFPYGITIDAEDNVWFPQLAADRLGVVNGRTGEVSEVVLPPVDEELTAHALEIGQRVGNINGAPAAYQKGPRRLGADRNGDAVWVCEFWAGRLAKIDIHTRKVTEYKVPSQYQYSHPYNAVVDKSHLVWFNMSNADRFAKFNPFTEQFTEYPLPTLGTNSRHIDLDNTTDPPTIWIPYTGSNKIARVQFRTSPARSAEARK